MVCDRCEECRLDGKKYCIYCGECLSENIDSCYMCEECRRKGMRFCIECGKELSNEKTVPEKDETLKTALFVMGMLAMIPLSILLVFEVLTMLWGVPNVLPFLENYKSSLILVVPAIVDIVTLSGLPLQIYYILLVIAVLISAAVIFRNAYKPTLALLKKDCEPIKQTALFEVCVLFGALYFIELIIFLIVQPTDSVEFDSVWEEMFQLLEAPVWEELITRVLYLGLPVLIVYAVTKRKELPFWRYLLGGWNKFDRTVLIFIVFSAAMFGLGHVFGSWGAWKFIPTFLFGLIAGYLFVKYGVYATIIFHFITDYMSSETYMFGGPAPVLTALMIACIGLVCIPYIWVYLKRGFLCVRSILWKRSE